MFDYGYAVSGGCGTSTGAGRNDNRTAITINATLAASFCYDTADRLTSVASTTAPYNAYTGTIGYDTRGNTTVLAGQELVYDGADRHMATYTPNTTTPTSSVVFERDMFDRIITRTETSGAGTIITRYGYIAPADTTSVILDNTGNITETVTALPGGVLLTTPAASTDVWSYPDVHGSILATADDTGTKQGATHIYDPDGNPITTTPDNLTGTADFGWLGQHRRLTDTTTGLQPVLHMGARTYDPALARFLQVDSIEAGNTNAYNYPTDPINQYDLDGQWGIKIGPHNIGDGCVLGTNPNGSCRGAEQARQLAPAALAVAAVYCPACAIAAAAISAVQTVRTCANGVVTRACGAGVISTTLAVTGAGMSVRAASLANRAKGAQGAASRFANRSATLNRRANVATNRAAASKRGALIIGFVWFNYDMTRHGMSIQAGRSRAV